MVLIYWIFYDRQLYFEICRGQPPDHLLKKAKSTSKFFKFVGTVDHIEAGHVSMGPKSSYQALSEEEYEAVSVCIHKIL